MIKEAILKLADRNDLSYEEALAVMNEIMDGQATPVQMSSYLTALSMKGETIEEITGSAKGMRDHCIPPCCMIWTFWKSSAQAATAPIPFNISTTAALVIAAGGVPGGKARQPGGFK